MGFIYQPVGLRPGLRAQFKAAATRLDQPQFLQLALPILNLCLSHRSPLDALLVIRPLEDAVHVNAGRVHLVGIDLARLHQMLNFGNRYSPGSRHHGIEILGCLPVHQVAPAVALPRLDEREVRSQRTFQHIRTSMKFARLLAFRHYCAESRRRVEGRDACSAGANALGERTLRDEFQIDAASQHHLFQQPVLADVASLVRLNLSGGEHQPQSNVINSHVVADGVQAFHTFLDQRADEVLGNTTQPEAPEHESVAILDVANSFVCVCNYLVHCHNSLFRRAIVPRCTVSVQKRIFFRIFGLCSVLAKTRIWRPLTTESRQEPTTGYCFFPNWLALSNSSRKPGPRRFSRRCASCCSKRSSASSRFWVLVSAISRHIE